MQSIKAFREETRATKHRMAFCLLKCDGNMKSAFANVWREKEIREV